MSSVFENIFKTNSNSPYANSRTQYIWSRNKTKEDFGLRARALRVLNRKTRLVRDYGYRVKIKQC